MNLFALDRPEPQRLVIPLTTRWQVVVAASDDGELAMAYFFDGELLHVRTNAAGEA
jgi:hypothetical protein